MLIKRWWKEKDVSTLVDFSLEEEDYNERMVFSRTARVRNTVEVAAVVPWGTISVEEGDEMVRYLRFLFNYVILLIVVVWI